MLVPGGAPSLPIGGPTRHLSLQQPRHSNSGEGGEGTSSGREEPAMPDGKVII